MTESDDRSRRGFLKTSSMLGLAVAFGPAVIGKPFANSAFQTTRKEDVTPHGNAAQRDGEEMAADETIRPFHAHFPESEITDLRRRIKATRWPERETVNDASQGVQLATTRKLADYWATSHNWSRCEAKLNALPLSYFPWLVAILAGYMVLTQMVKGIYARRYGWQ